MLPVFSSPAWSPPPRSLSLEPGWVHIFRLKLDDQPPLPEDHWQVLSTAEQERATRFHSPLLRRHFIYAHYLVRQILAAYLLSSPAALQFTLGPFGKPHLTAGYPLRFNLSHSAGMGLLAVCAGQEVGIDLEAALRNVDRKSIARRFFSPHEAAAIAALPLDQQPAAFLACWTRKEAYIKARGGGLSIPLDSFQVSVVPGAPVRLFDPADDPLPNSGWTIVEIDPGAGFISALAVEGSLVGWKCWDWPG